MPEAELVLSAGDIVVRLTIVLLLVLANGFFVASEFALVAARRTRIEALEKQGKAGARFARRAKHHLDHYLSATQLGITLASLALGWVGESTLAAILIQSFEGMDIVVGHTIAAAVAFTVITVLHIVLGELAPKSMAILHPEGTSVWTAGPLIAFSWVLTPFIWSLNGLANRILRLLGLRTAEETERVHSPQEIEMLLTQSFQHGHLREEPVEMIRGVFDLSETTAAQVMTPRTEIVAIPAESTTDRAAEVILEAGHSRMPVYEESLDQVVGLVLAREVWRAQRDGHMSIEELVRPIPFVPDSKPIEALLREMQRDAIHMVVVVDEFGGTAGIVTLEDLVEEIVGEIRDEHEHEPPEIEETPSGEVLVDGGVPVVELNELYGLKIPEEDFTSAGGFVMGLLGRIPEVGEEVEFPGGRIRVIEMEGRRIERIALSLSPVEGPVREPERT